MAAALVALLSYSFLQVGLYGAFGPNAASEAAAHLGVHAAWWKWALGAWAVITVLGLLRVDITGRVLGVLLSAEILVIFAETISGLARPAGGHFSFATLSPAALTSAGFGTFGVLAVVAVLGFVGLRAGARAGRRSPQRPPDHPGGHVLRPGHDRRRVRRGELGHGRAQRHQPRRGRRRAAGPGAAVRPGRQRPLSQAAQWLFLTSLFAAALAFHNVVWRYMYALGRENVLPAALGRTGGNNIPKAASLAQSATGLAVILVYAAGGWPPMTDLFFWLGTTGGFGIIILLALTAVAVIAFFARDSRGETAWPRLIAPALAAAALTGIVVLAATHYDTLLGVPAGACGRLGPAGQLRRGRRDRAGLGAGPEGLAPAGATRPSGSALTPSPASLTPASEGARS